MKQHPDFDTRRGPRNGYDDQLDPVRPGAGRNLYHEMSGRNDASIQSKDMLKDFAQSTAAETAQIRAITGLVAENNEARAELASVIAPPAQQIEAKASEADPPPRFLRPAPAQQRPTNPRLSRLADQITEAVPRFQRQNTA